MTPLDLARADRELRAAAKLVGHRIGYPPDPEARHRELVGYDRVELARRHAIVVELHDEARDVLQVAVRAERDAREAQERAVLALRKLGAYSPSWAHVGELVGMSGQGAHRRYAAAAARPPAELTIDDELAGA